jgi:formylmethanofuran dehydrogenase subunit C
VSDAVHLISRTAAGEAVEIDVLSPDRLASMSESEIAALPVWIGGRAAKLGDAFDVRGASAARLRVEGDLRNVHGLGSRMAGGELLIDGNVGSRLGAHMSAGWIDVRGDAGDDAGVAMSGGALRIVGNAGARVGAAAPGASKGMTGGEIVVNGSVGPEAAARARRGLIAVAEDAGEHAGRAMIAGTLIVFGRVGPHPGRGSKRGSIVALGGVAVPATYRYACTYQPPHVRLLLTYLRRRYGLSGSDEALERRFLRFCGDAGEPGKGEILVLETVSHGQTPSPRRSHWA